MGPVGRLAPDVSGSGKGGGDLRPRAAAPDELRVEGGQRDQPPAAQHADPIKALHFQEGLPLEAEQFAAGSVDTGLREGFKGQVFGQEQVSPALADGALHRLAELDEHMPGPRGGHGPGGELGLFSPR